MNASRTLHTRLEDAATCFGDEWDGLLATLTARQLDLAAREGAMLAEDLDSFELDEWANEWSDDDEGDGSKGDEARELYAEEWGRG